MRTTWRFVVCTEVLIYLLLFILFHQIERKLEAPRLLKPEPKAVRENTLP